MESMPRRQIENIASVILNSGDIIAKHGTSIEKALSILNEGFDFHRSSYAIQTSKDIETLCKYGWKNNKPGDSTNVIIEVPREFFIDLFSISSIDDYNNWIQEIKNKNMQEVILNSVTTFEYVESEEMEDSLTPPAYSAHIPREFIAGAFIWCNGKTYLNLEEGENSLDNLSFVPNEKFYLNLQPDEKRNFLREMKDKLGIDERGKSL